MDPISSSGKIRIKFPSTVTIQVTAANCAVVVGTALATSPTCTVSTADNSITLTSINSSSSVIPAQTFTVSIEGIKNPESIGLVAGFVVSTFYTGSDSALTSKGTVVGFTSTSATIYPAQVLITASEYIVNESPITYSFSLKVQHPIPVGGSLKLYVPSVIGVNVATVFGHCEVNTNGISYRATACTGSAHNSSHTLIHFSNPFIDRV